MARYEFKFVISDVELSDEHRERVGEAIAQAGALAVCGSDPRRRNQHPLRPRLVVAGLPADRDPPPRPGVCGGSGRRRSR